MSRIRGFDGVRGLAALSVVATHAGLFAYLNTDYNVPYSILRSLDGIAAVQAFFALSGFLIISLLIVEFKRFGKIDIPAFFIRRSIRIFPLYFLAIAIVLALQLLFGGLAGFESLAFASLYITNFIPKEWYSGILGHTWSLAVEEHFYLIWPFICVVLLPKLSRLMSGLLLFLAVAYFSSLYFSSNTVFASEYFPMRWSFIAESSIALGCLFAILTVSCRNSNLLSRASLLLIPLIFVSAVWPGLSEANSYFFRGLGFAAFVLFVYLNQKSRIVAFLEARPLRYLGSVSYGIYIYQGIVLTNTPFRHEGAVWPPSPEVGIAMLILVVPLSYHFFEMPLLKFKARWERSKLNAKEFEVSGNKEFNP